MNWQAVVEKTVTGLGLELVECERSTGGLLRVYIDHPPAAAGLDQPLVSVDDCERVTRQLQYVLEVEACDYSRLEVSSPGLDRPLRTAEHYARFSGLQVDLTLRMPFQGRKKFRGLLNQGEGESWTLLFGEKGQEQVMQFQLEEVREARLVPVIDFKGRGKRAAPSQDQKKPDGDQTP